MKAKLSCAVLFILFLGTLQWCEGRGVEQEGQPLIQLSHGKLSNKPVKLFIICICIPSYTIVSIVLELDGMLKIFSVVVNGQHDPRAVVAGVGVTSSLTFGFMRQYPRRM